MKKLKETLVKLNNYKLFILLTLILIGAFYWWQIRPAHIRSSCSQIAVLRAKEGSYSTDLYNTYESSTSSITYNGFNTFLEKEYKNDKDFAGQTYDTKDYNFEYSRCLHEYCI